MVSDVNLHLYVAGEYAAKFFERVDVVDYRAALDAAVDGSMVRRCKLDPGLKASGFSTLNFQT